MVIKTLIQQNKKFLIDRIRHKKKTKRKIMTYEP